MTGSQARLAGDGARSGVPAEPSDCRLSLPLRRGALGTGAAAGEPDGSATTPSAPPEARCSQRRAAVMEHNRQHRWQTLRFQDLPSPDQIQIQQTCMRHTRTVIHGSN